MESGRVEGKIGELICFNTVTAPEIVAYFLIDDGLPTRKRRSMLLDSSYKYIGIGHALHTKYTNIWVILLAQDMV